MKRILSILILLSVVVSVSAQKQTRREIREKQRIETQRMVDSLLNIGEFTFIAQRVVTSLAERPNITLNGADFIRVDKNNLVSSLPFYGQLYTAPLGSSDSPLSFTSDSFTYEILAGRERKNMVQIKVKTKGVIGSCVIVLEIFSDATAVANITMDRGSSSMFFGYIRPTKPKTDK